MKKCMLLLPLLNSILFFSQVKEEVSFNKNEFKINIASTIDKYPEFTYERLLNEETAMGISLGFTIDSKTNIDETTNYKYSIVPYYRFYFGKKIAAGFFIEANTPLFSQKKIEGSFFNASSEGGIGFGLGLAIGGKFMTKSGWVGEIYTGVARSFVNTDKIGFLYPRVGITIGKRF